MANIPQLVGNEGTDFNEMHNAEVLDTLNEVITKVNAFTGEGTGDERIDALEAVASTPTEKAWLTSELAAVHTGITAAERGYLPASAEKSWLTSELAASHTGMTSTERGYLPSSAEKSWLTGEQAASHVGVTAAERAILTALQAGGTSFFAQLGAPVLADADRIVTTVDWDDGTLSIAAQPDVPRNITATLTDADNSTSGLVTITGTDIAGRVVTEAMAPNGAGGGKTLVGTKIFKTITSVVITESTGSGDDDELVVGVGNVIGVPVDLADDAEIVAAHFGGVLLVTPTVVTGVSTSGINASASVYNGVKVLDAVIQMGLT